MKLINKVITIFTLVLCLTGCSEFLEDEIQYTKPEEILTSGVRSRGLIDHIYQEYSNKFTTDFEAEYLTDNGVSNTGETNFSNGNWGVSSAHPYVDVWQQSYDNMRDTYQYIDLVHNTGLAYRPAAGDSILNRNIIRRYYGEAFFIKAFAEWELLKIFGGESESGEMLGFPIVNGILENEEYANLSRNTYQECVDQIIDDLQIAIDSLPLVYGGSAAANPGTDVTQTGRASGMAAYALKAKVALMAASPAFNPTNDLSKWELAATYAKEVIDLNGGLKSLRAIDFSNANNPDHFWRTRNSLQVADLERSLYPPTLFGQGVVNPSQNLVDAFPAANGYPIDNALSVYDATAPYTSRDARFYRTVFYNGDQCFETASCTDYEAIQIYEGGLDYYGGFFPSVGTRTGFYLKKFLNNLDFDPSVIAATTSLPRLYVQLGLTETYLGYAEALNEAFGQPSIVDAGHSFSAKEVLAKVRLRAGISTDPYLDIVSGNQDDFRDFLKNERRIELCFTGERFHDLRRWKDIVNTADIKGIKVTKNTDATFSYEGTDVESRGYEEKNYYLPIPYSETLINTNLKQNKGW